MTALMALVGALLPATAARAAGPAGAPAPRATWVWNVPADPATLIGFATAHGIRRIFLAVPPDVASSSLLPRVQATARAAHAAGIAVDALGGDPGWVGDPAWVVSHWLQPALATGLFDGVHLDVEPYADPSWRTDQQGTVTGLLSLLSTLVSSAGRAHPVEADIPFWYGTVPAGKHRTLDAAVLARVAGVTVMAYRNVAAGPDGTLDVAAPTLAAAAAAGKPIRIGQETTYLGSDPSQTKQTFYGSTGAAFDQQAAVIDASQAGIATYAGIAVEDSDGWAALYSR